MFIATPDLTRSLQQLSPEEQKAVTGAFSNPGQTQASGVRLAGQKYFTLSIDDRSIYGKKGVRDILATSSYECADRML